MQEDGVDEDDVIKSDGSTIVTLSVGTNAQLAVHRLLASGSTQVVGNVVLGAAQPLHTPTTPACTCPPRMHVWPCWVRWFDGKP
ncbi:MAG: beta-propeller domain-containing protein [Burkholderiales bacterium]